MLNLTNVASILNWTLAETEESWEELCDGFMTPQIDFFHVDPESANGYLGAGFYGRLSASGYLDCTDWHGPHPTEDEAVADLLSTYCNF